MDILGWTPTTPAVVVGNTTNWQVAGIGDFNGDHTSDVLWRYTDGTVGVWEMNNLQIMAQGVIGQPAAVPLSSHIVGTGDFDGNGTSDILWRDSSGNVAIWEMNGTQLVAAGFAGPGPVPLNWQIVGTGDFNGDGKTDILWRDNNSGNVAIWEMNGTQLATATLVGSGPVPLNCQIVGTGDFNGDGKTDILWRDNGGNVAIWEMNGTQLATAALAGPGPVPLNWQIVGTGDFNGDGKTDILWRDSNSGDVVIWEMNGTQLVDAGLVGSGPMPLSFHVAGVGDFDGDGKADVLWRGDDGTVEIWDMNGLGTPVSTIVSTVATTAAGATPPVTPAGGLMAEGATAKSAVPSVNSGDPDAAAIAGTTGTMPSGQSGSSAGSVVGVAGPVPTGLADIGFATHSTLGSSVDSGNFGGTPTVSNGPQLASIALMGQFMASSFATPSGQQGGMTIHDAIGTAQNPIAAPHA
jgi:WD40 repeat protein